MGGLVRASDETEDQVRRVNEAFNRLHGHGFKLKMGADMLERTVRFILRQKICQDIDIMTNCEVVFKNKILLPIKVYQPKSEVL